LGSTSGAKGTLRICTFKIFSRPKGPDWAPPNLAVETARAQQRGIEHIGPVSGGDQDHALIGLEAIHLDQQLIQRLFAFVIAATEAGATMAPDPRRFRR